MLRKLLVLMGVLALFVAACGDDGGSDADGASGGDDPSADQRDDGDADADGTSDDSAPGGGGGTVFIAGEDIALSGARCFFEEQDAAGQQITATAQASGTNAAGEEVLVDFTRFGEESDFTGDDISVTIGDPFSPDAGPLTANLPLGTVQVTDSGVRADGFEWQDDQLQSAGAASFVIDC